MSNVTNEDKLEQLEASNQVILGVANQYLENQHSKKVESTILYIQQEVDKIQKKEFTIAVVGELKSGKSTFINALVGYDISHSRATAATTYPVKIKHKQGYKKGSIKLHATELFWQHVNKLETALQSSNFEDTFDKSEYNNTVKYIKSGKFTKENYTQDNLEINQIQGLLEVLHDLPRISPDILPTEGIQDLTTKVIPEISLEFPTIRLHANNQEGIILIDTPGLGEKGDINDFIKPTIEKEMKDASVVMCVLKNGGIGSANEAKIKEIMKSVSSSYVIAGQMDEYNRDNADTPIKELLQIIENRYADCNLEEVFPIAQRDVAQGIKIQDYFDKHGELEDPHVYGSNFKNHPSYDILKGFNRKWLKPLDKREDGYKEFLRGGSEVDEFSEFVNDKVEEMINPTNYPFSTVTDEFKDLAVNVLKKTVESHKKKFYSNISTLKNEITMGIETVDLGAEPAREALNKINNLETNLKSVSTSSIKEMNEQINHMGSLKEDLLKNTSTELNTLLTDLKNDIHDYDLENNNEVSKKSRKRKKKKSKNSNEKSASAEQDKDLVVTEPARNFVAGECKLLVTHMKNNASEEIATLLTEVTNLKNQVNEQLLDVTEEYKTIANDTFNEITFPTLDNYIAEENISLESMDMDIDLLIDRNITNGSWWDWDIEWNPLSWFPKRYSYTSFDVDKFYEQLKGSVKDTINKDFIPIDNLLENNLNKINSFKEDLNDHIEDMISKLKDTDKYSNDIELAKKTKKELEKFIETIDLHQELITKF